MKNTPQVDGNRRFTLVLLAEVVPCDVVSLIDHLELAYPGRIKPGVTPVFREIEAVQIRKSFRFRRRVILDKYHVQLGGKRPPLTT